MPKKVGTTQWRKQRRKEYLEKKEYRYYIFCEGEQTEPLYFEGFKRLIEDNPIYKDMVLIEIEPCAAETMRVIGMAERYVRKNGIDRGQIWCVYDKDSFPAKDFNGVTERVDKLNLENPKLAIRYAKRIIEENKEKSPADIALGTKVYELVEELARYFNNDNVGGRTDE